MLLEVSIAKHDVDAFAFDLLPDVAVLGPGDRDDDQGDAHAQQDGLELLFFFAKPSRSGS